MTTERIELIVTKDQALVLFEWLAHLDSSPGAPSDNSAEKRVLWALEAQLERVLAEPFTKNYPQVLEDARRKIQASS